MDDIILFFALKYNGHFDKILRALQNKEPFDEKLFKELRSKMNCNYVTLIDPEYPEILKEINYPPFVLFYKGNINLLKQNACTVLGSKTPSEYGKKMTEHIVKTLADNNIVIVCGMENGVDKVIHQSVIKHSGKVISLLPCGINYCYPEDDKELYENSCNDQLVISEYPFDIPPHESSLSKSSRIAVGLGKKLIVTESKKRSHAMVAAKFAVDDKKEIICIPYRLNEDSGCNYLLWKNWAKPFLETSDLF